MGFFSAGISEVVKLPNNKLLTLDELKIEEAALCPFCVSFVQHVIGVVQENKAGFSIQERNPLQHIYCRSCGHLASISRESYSKIKESNSFTGITLGQEFTLFGINYLQDNSLVAEKHIEILKYLDLSQDKDEYYLSSHELGVFFFENTITEVHDYILCTEKEIFLYTNLIECSTELEEERWVDFSGGLNNIISGWEQSVQIISETEDDSTKYLLRTSLDSNNLALLETRATLLGYGANILREFKNEANTEALDNQAESGNQKINVTSQDSVADSQAAFSYPTEEIVMECVVCNAKGITAEKDGNIFETRGVMPAGHGEGPVRKCLFCGVGLNIVSTTGDTALVEIIDNSLWVKMEKYGKRTLMMQNHLRWNSMLYIPQVLL